MSNKDDEEWYLKRNYRPHDIDAFMDRRRLPITYEGEFPNMHRVFTGWQKTYRAQLMRYMILNGQRVEYNIPIMFKGILLPMTDELKQQYGGEGQQRLRWFRLYVDGMSIPYLDPPFNTGDYIFVDKIIAKVVDITRFGQDGSFVRLIINQDWREWRTRYTSMPIPPTDEEWNRMKNVKDSEVEAWQARSYLDHFIKKSTKVD